MAQKFQMVQIDSNGSAVVFHPETNADQVLSGTTNKVPTVANINDWVAKSSEVVAARKGQASLKAKIDLIDNALVASQLLTSIKTVDGSGSGLDADTVDGKNVDDASTASTAIWTASKTMAELNKKVNTLDVVTTAVPNKILRLDATGKLKADLIGNAIGASGLIRDGSMSITVIDNEIVDSEALWTSDKIDFELKVIDYKITQVQDSTTITSSEVYSLGGLVTKFGTIDISGKEFIDIVFPQAFTTAVLYDGLSVESSDAELSVVKAPGELTTSGTGYNFNKVAPAGSKLTWFVVGH